MHGGLAFESFRTAASDSPLYRKGMSHWSLAQLEKDVRDGTLAQVSWVLPPQLWSEHPSPSSPLHGAEFTARVLDALTANPDVWSRTVFFQTFDENDGQFDHVPPPAPPSYNSDGSLAGRSTLDLRGEYFDDRDGTHLNPEDTISGRVRPWGLGPRVPMYVVSPWSKGGWVNSQVFDHTSVGQFLEKRFGITIPAISPWHRAVCGDLTSAFDFERPNDPVFPGLPDVDGASSIVLQHIQRPRPEPPEQPQPLFQEPGARPSRALPYELNADVRSDAGRRLVSFGFRNSGKAGAVLHLYDRRHLDRIPRRYTVEAGKSLEDALQIPASDEGAYDFWIYGPNKFLREIRGRQSRSGSNAQPEVDVVYDRKRGAVILRVSNFGEAPCTLEVRANAYQHESPWRVTVAPGRRAERRWPVDASGNWYDFSVSADHDSSYLRRFAGRLETDADGISDPAMGA